MCWLPVPSFPRVVCRCELEAFDVAMVAFMTSNAIPAGALGIMKDGVVVFERAYGWADEEQTEVVLPDVLMRLASVTKPITASAVRKLIAAGSIGLNDAVFDLGQPGGGLLNYEPFGVPDARLQDITVEHLLLHTGGWDRDVAGDLTYRWSLRMPWRYPVLPAGSTRFVTSWASPCNTILEPRTPIRISGSWCWV